jgi:hypothetical protein
MADNNQIIDRKRIRKINGSFSWIPHKLITGGFLEDMSTYEISLYFFLIAVCDRNGVSFYHDDRLCRLLKIDLARLGEAREGLIQRSLVAYKLPVYQVLALPPKPVAPPTAEQLAEEKKKRDLYYINKIKQIVSRRPGAC